MTIQDTLDDIEQTASAQGLAVPDRLKALKWMSRELTELSGRMEWTWAMVHLDPLIQTTDGKYDYDLPSSFGLNFVRHAGDDGTKWCVKISDGVSASLLDYKSPPQFWGQDVANAESSRPSCYTIMATSDGRKQIWLYPSPDDSPTQGYYTVDGLYIPTDWKLTELRGLPVIVASSPILKYAVLRRLAPQVYQPLYNDALAQLIMQEAQNHDTRMVAVLNDGSSTFNQFDQW